MLSTPDEVVCSISAFSTCRFHVVPRVPGCVADEKIGPVVLYGRIKTGTNCVHLFIFWIALTY